MIQILIQPSSKKLTRQQGREFAARSPARQLLITTPLRSFRPELVKRLMSKRKVGRVDGQPGCGASLQFFDREHVGLPHTLKIT